MTRPRWSLLLPGAVLLLLSCRPAPNTPATTATPAPQEPAADPTSRPLVPAPAEQPLSIFLTIVSSTSLTLEVKDASLAPVRTDLWLYRRDGERYVPFSDFTVPGAKRRSPNFMLPAEVLGASTSFSPADDGGRHGLMTDGSNRDAIDGSVEVTLNQALPDGTRLLVAAALEDQRYYGARTFELPTGGPGPVPLFNTPVPHVRRTFQDDVKPILAKSCISCHAAGNWMPMETHDDLLNRGLYDSRTEFLVEAGAPALSGFVRRTRPGLGAEAKKWYGKQGRRWSIDFNGVIIGDRRMPPESTRDVTSEADGSVAYFDTHLDEYRILWDWVAQGAPER